MILGIGCDIVEHEITASLGWSSNYSILKRVYTEKELEIFKKKKTDKFLSGRFAAKEAVLKCLGTGMKDGIALTDIEILQTDIGQPIVYVMGEVESIANKMGVNNWHISISHTESLSYAFVIAEK